MLCWCGVGLCCAFGVDCVCGSGCEFGGVSAFTCGFLARLVNVLILILIVV